MTVNLTDIVDTTAKRLISGEPIPIILADYPTQAEVLQPLLHTAAMLETLRPVEIPSPESLQADRDEFLAKVTDLQQQPVSTGPLNRLKEWIVHNFPWHSLNLAQQRKEQWRMSSLFIKTMLIFSVIFGSVGGTAVYASNSLPDSPVYPLKLTMEQVQLALTTDPIAQANIHLNLAQERTQEMERMAQQGSVPDNATLTRLQQHLNQAFQLAAQLPNEQMQGLLTQTQQMLQTKTQQLTQTQAQVNEPTQEALRQANQLLNQAQQEAEAGLQDPRTFRWRHTHGQDSEPPGGPCASEDCEPEGNQNQQQNGPPPEAPAGPCETDDCEPVGDQNQNQNQHQHQNQNGSQAQEPGGPCPTDECDPAGDQIQNQNQNQHQHQNDSQSPEPGGPCLTDECEPEGDANHYGQQADRPGAPHNDPNCEGDCDPVGDQHQNGSPPEEQPGPGEPGGNPDGNENHHGTPSDQAGGQNGGDNSGGDNNNDNGNDNDGNSDNGNSNDNGGNDNSGNNDSGGGDNSNDGGQNGGDGGNSNNGGQNGGGGGGGKK
ncbi:DUF5667 domain-containing protein [Chloroflexota bacterium]